MKRNNFLLFINLGLAILTVIFVITCQSKPDDND